MKTTMCPFAAPALVSGLLLFCAGIASAQPHAIEPDLAGALGERGWKLINRAAEIIDKDGVPALRLKGSGGTGFVRIADLEFADGTIECDFRGRDVPQQSFLGIAFHGSDTGTYDAVYFRPFNFKAGEPRRTRAVQYISHPMHTWNKLREQFPGQYENAVKPVPDPEDWFRVRIVIAWPRVSAFVNDATEPCLVVEQLSDRKRGWIALWTDVNGGDFANLKIIQGGRNVR